MAKKRSILIVEDDPSISFGLQEVFDGEGFNVSACDRGDEVITALGNSVPDLILLDVMLPGKNGFDVCKEIRARGLAVPILMLTSKGQELDKVIGLDSGADDYVTKPFGVRELVARVNALLRRTATSGAGSSNNGGPDKTPFKVGDSEIHPKTFEVCCGERTENLTPKEMDLIVFFDRHRDEVLSRDEILDAVWGINYYGTTRTLDQCVAQLRKKIGDNGSKPRHLLTVHGVGYKLVGQG